MTRKDVRFNPRYIKNTTNKRKDDKVQGEEIGNGTILSKHIADGNITGEKLASTINHSGYYISPNRPAFLVGWNGSVAVSPTPKIIPLNGVVKLNRGAHLKTDQNRFICPIEGLYMFGFSYLRTPSAVVVRGNIYKNGINLQQQLRTTEGYSGFNYTAGQWYIVYAQANEYIDLRISADSNTTLYNDGGGLAYNWFCGYLIG